MAGMGLGWFRSIALTNMKPGGTHLGTRFLLGHLLKGVEGPHGTKNQPVRALTGDAWKEILGLPLDYNRVALFFWGFEAEMPQKQSAALCLSLLRGFFV